MFISSASIDDNETHIEREYEAGSLTSDLVSDLVKSLDGRRHTLVTLSPGLGEAHMAIGGSAGQGLVVYVTADNMVFYNLVTNAPRPLGSVVVVAGGQSGGYESRYVVTIEECLTAAIRYAETGDRAEGLKWVIQE